jgi:hypothetical protein
MPVKSPELTRTSPSACETNASPAGISSPPGGATTCWIGSPNLVAKSKSRWSCAGTAMTAPVPYSIST